MACLATLGYAYVQRSWRQLCDVTITGSYQTGLETTTCRRLQGPSQLSKPLYSQIILRIHAAMNGLGGGAETEFVPGRWKVETLGTPLPSPLKSARSCCNIEPVWSNSLCAGGNLVLGLTYARRGWIVVLWSRAFRCPYASTYRLPTQSVACKHA